MTNEGDVNVASTTNIRMDGGRKIFKEKRHHKSSKEMLFDPTPSKELTCHPHFTIETSDDDCGNEAIDATIGEEWDTRGQMES